MSTEIAQIAESAIQQTARDLSAAHQIASALSTTAFVPTHFRGKPDDCAAAILYGSTVGMDAMTSLQNLYVIGGKPALYSRPMVGIVLAQGHEVWTDVDTPERVVVCGRRKGSTNVERSEWTVERAKKAGYTSNKKYQSDPQAMLYARAAGDVARKVAPDALLGMAYNVEELEVAQDDKPAPRRVDSEQVQQSQPSIAPTEQAVSRIPNDLALRIAGMDDPAKLDQMVAWLGGLSGEDATEVADLQALCAARVEELVTPEPEPAPEVDVHDAAQQTLADVIDAEEVPAC